MTERTAATVSAESFDTFWLIGLSWGVVAGTVTAGLAIASALVITQGITFASLFGGLIVFVIATFYALLGAVLLAIVAIGHPPWINTFDPLTFRTEPSTVVVFVWFALAGAFGGFMAGCANRLRS